MQEERRRRTWAAPGAPGRQGGGGLLSQGKPTACGEGVLARRVLGGGQAHDTGKDVTEVHSLHRRLLPDTVGPEPQKPTCLRGIANKAKADQRHRFRDLYRCVDAELLLDCWQDLKKEAASGGDHVTADAYAATLPGTIEALVQRLTTKRYRAKLVRRCDMPKANGKAPRDSRFGRPTGAPGLCAAVDSNLCASFSGVQ
jgi:hypothetical protein